MNSIDSSASTQKDITKSKKERPPKVNLKVPNVAWWTLFLFVGCWVVWVGAFVATMQGFIPYFLGLFVLSVAAFATFTPMHDAVHRSVARARWVNEVVGRVSVLLIISPFVAFRYVHLEHHKHTNHEHKDPDFWSGRGPTWLLPFRWFTQDLHYYYVYLSNWKKRPVAERRETLLTLIGMWGFVGFLCWSGYAWPTLFLWVLPSRFAIAFLAYSFDYLPHKPHHILSSENRYKATLVRPHPLLTPVLFYQNFHLIHHLYPGVPFYRYAEIWRKQKSFLLKQGTEVRSLTGQVQTEKQC